MSNSFAGDKLKSFRKSMGWTQSHLASYLGVSASIVSMYEGGQRAPGRETLIKMAHVFRVPMDEFSVRRSHIDICDFSVEVRTILASSVGSDYAWYLSNDDEFLNAVRDDVEETSSWNDDGYYTDDDIRLAIGRVLMWKFGIEY